MFVSQVKELVPLECEAKPFHGRRAPLRTIQADIQCSGMFGCIAPRGGEHVAHRYRCQLQLQDVQGSWESCEPDGTLRLQLALSRQQPSVPQVATLTPMAYRPIF